MAQFAPRNARDRTCQSEFVRCASAPVAAAPALPVTRRRAWSRDSRLRERARPAALGHRSLRGSSRRSSRGSRRGEACGACQAIRRAPGGRRPGFHRPPCGMPPAEYRKERALFRAACAAVPRILHRHDNAIVLRRNKLQDRFPRVRTGVRDNNAIPGTQHERTPNHAVVRISPLAAALVLFALLLPSDTTRHILELRGKFGGAEDLAARRAADTRSSARIGSGFLAAYRS